MTMTCSLEDLACCGDGFAYSGLFGPVCSGHCETTEEGAIKFSLGAQPFEWGPAR